MSQQPFNSDGGFSTTGNITVGNILIAGTIEPSVSASPAPSLNGFLNIDAVGNITAGNVLTDGYYYANGAPFSGGGGGNYGNANVATFLASYGSNTISTTGTITSGNILSNGYARLSGSFDESQASTAGLYLGYAGGTPRMMFGTGNTNQTLEIDNDGGTLRFYKPGTTLASLTNTGNFSVTGNITAGNIIAPASTANTQILFNNAGVVGGSAAFTFDTNGNTLNLANSSSTLKVADIQTPTAGVSLRLIPASGITYSYGNFLPLFANTYDLGGSGSRWNNMWANVANVITLNTTGNIVTGGQIQSTAFTGGNISWSASNQTDFQGSIKLGGLGRILSPGGAASIETNNNGANISLLRVTSTAVAANTTSGGLIVSGGAGIAGNAYIGGTVTTGISALVAGATNTLLANTVAGFTGNVNNYTQVTFQNLNTGADATADFILTANNGNDVVNYGDFGIINSGYDNSTPTNSLGNIVYAADTYIYAQGNISNTSQSGGNLVIGTTTATKNVKIFAGGNTASSLVANISNIGISQPNLPAFRVYGNGVTNGLNVTTNGDGTLNGNNWAVDYNQGSYLNSTTGVFTAPVAGLYQVNLNARCANNSAPASQAIVYKNYGTANIVQVMWEVAANTTVNHFGVSTVSKLAVGDTLVLKATTGNVTFDPNDSWSVAFLG